MATNVSTQNYKVMCFGNPVITTVTNDPLKVTEWITRVQSSIHSDDDILVIGLDVEWRPTFPSGHKNPVATLQLCFKDKCLIFQIIHSRYVPDSLKNFLSNRAYTFVGVGVKSDVEKLERDYGFGSDANAVDLGDVAVHRYGRFGRRDVNSLGLKDLYMFVFDQVFEKPISVTTSNWDDERLSSDQVKYACYDALVSYEIGAKLRADDLGFNLDMWQWPNVPSLGFGSSLMVMAHNRRI